jgi:hypothetical protein
MFELEKKRLFMVTKETNTCKCIPKYCEFQLAGPEIHWSEASTYIDPYIHHLHGSILTDYHMISPTPANFAMLLPFVSFHHGVAMIVLSALNIFK